MIGRRYPIGRVCGIDLRVDLGCITVSILLAWMLATGLFPERYLGLSSVVLWLMGIAGSVGLFLSVVAHELGHALVARRAGIGVDGITLFIFGGAAEMDDEPSTPRDELDMAAAGPFVSLALATICFALTAAHQWVSWPIPVLALLEYLAATNAVLAVFNLIPAFPLDGGRILRAILWSRTRCVQRATRIAARTSAVFGWVFVLLGLVEMARAEIASAVWWVLIGLFVRAMSAASHRDVVARFAVEAK